MNDILKRTFYTLLHTNKGDCVACTLASCIYRSKINLPRSKFQRPQLNGFIDVYVDKYSEDK